MIPITPKSFTPGEKVGSVAVSQRMSAARECLIQKLFEYELKALLMMNGTTRATHGAS
jgi:hypothetical protein